MREVLNKQGKKSDVPFAQSLKKVYARFLEIRGEPRDIALGFALGLFVGMTPTMGFQTPLAVFFAALFKLNKISAAIGVWITNPVTAPVIYGITYITGAKLLGLQKAFSPAADIGARTIFEMVFKAPEIFWALFIGGLIFGIPIAVAGYYFSYSAVMKYQGEIKKKIASRKEKMAQRKGNKRRKNQKKKK